MIAPGVAATPAGTPEVAGFSPHIAVPLLGVSSVPGKKPPQVESSSHPIQSPPCQRHCRKQDKGIPRRRWLQGLCSLELKAEPGA